MLTHGSPCSCHCLYSNDTERGKRVREWVFCNHCQREVSHATFYLHKRFRDIDVIHSANNEDDHLSDLMSSNEDDDNESIEELYNDSLPYKEVHDAEVHICNASKFRINGGRACSSA